MADVGPVSTLTARTPLILSGDRLYIDDGAGGDFSVSLAVLAASVLASPTITGHATIEGVTATGATGTGKLVFDGTPTLVTPVLGVATATSINKVAFTAPAASATLTIANTKTLTVSNTLTLAGTDATTMTFPTTSATIARTDAAQSFTGIQTFVAPILGTPTSGTLTNCTGLPAAGVVGTAAVLGANTFTGDQTISSASLIFSGNISAAAWTTAGIRHKGAAASFTDTSSSGTVAAAYTNNFGVGTILASSATTYTNYFGSYFSDPVASTNVTMTNKWALGADSAKITTIAGTTLALGGATIGANVLSAAGSLNFQYAVGTGNNWTLSSGGTLSGNSASGTKIFIAVSSLINLSSAYVLGWANGVDLSVAPVDTSVARLGPANLRLGANPSATPIANIITIGEAPRPGTDSNVGGANGTVQSGLGTGTGTPSSLILQSPTTVASGTTTQTYVTGLKILFGTAVLTSYTVATLPSAATAGAGATAFVTDASTTLILGLGGTVTGGGANKVPVYSDGTNWIYG